MQYFLHVHKLKIIQCVITHKILLQISTTTTKNHYIATYFGNEGAFVKINPKIYQNPQISVLSWFQILLFPSSNFSSAYT